MSKKKTKKHVHSERLILVFSFIIFATILTAIGLTVWTNKPSPFCANAISCISNLTGTKETASQGIFMGRTITIPNEPDTPVFALERAKQVLGSSTPNSKHIYVDLNMQQLYAYENDELLYSFPISSGKWNKTPTGDFTIWVWLKYTRMAGGSKEKGDYYDLPNVPYTMYFANTQIPRYEGYSIHGAYWHNNFGYPMSHGCINMRTQDAKEIFYWTNPLVKHVAYVSPETPGTPITIYGTTPK